MQAPEAKERLGKLGAEQMNMTPEEFNGYIKADIAATPGSSRRRESR